MESSFISFSTTEGGRKLIFFSVLLISHTHGGSGVALNTLFGVIYGSGLRLDTLFSNLESNFFRFCHLNHPSAGVAKSELDGYLSVILVFGE